MRRPRLSTEFFMLVGVLLAVIGFLATAGLTASQKALDNTLEFSLLIYSTPRTHSAW